MTKIDKEKAREERIKMEIVVDAYDQYERAIGWYTYLEDTIRFPFEARCTGTREVSPLEEGETAQVIEMSSIEASESEMFVTIEWIDRELGVPLAQLEPIAVDSDTKQAVADWHYWDGRGYRF
ncbi:calcium-binding protein [Natronococcus roseus]|uniref:calcium-binding protein n=1 Tax=Natronococcus roseus TaxID=1052014 RepID=UPI00374C94C8